MSNTLSVKTKNLSSAAPIEWRDFLSAFAEYTNDIGLECIQSPPKALKKAQGRAQHCMQMLRLFETASKR